MLYWNSCGVWLPAAKKRDSQCKSLVEKEKGGLFKGYTNSEWWQIFAIKSHSLYNTPKHIILPPLPTQARFRIPQSEVPSLRIAEICGSAFPVTVQHSRYLSLIRTWLGRSQFCRQGAMFSGKVSQQVSSFLLQLLIQNHMASSNSKPCGTS